MTKKRPVGRPAIGERYLIILDALSAAIGRKLGAGNLSKGVREALRLASAKSR
jgi:hypothetical protein